MSDQRTMAELLRAPTEGYAEAIVVPLIPDEHFELKHSLINLVTSKQFFGFEKEDPYAHIRYFNKITSTLKYKDCFNNLSSSSNKEQEELWQQNSSKAITPDLSTEEPDNSLSMGDEHLDTILETESDEVIKSVVGTLSHPNDVDVFEIHRLHCGSPPDLQLVSLEEVKDDILREKLLNINLLIAKIESLKDNSTPDCVLKSPSLFPIPVKDKEKRVQGKDIDTGFEDISTGFEDISTGFEEVNIGGLGVSTGSGPVSSARGQREGKAPMIVEETQAPKRTKEQIQQEEASLAEAIRLQTLEEEETAKQVHLDALLAKRMEEEDLTEQQKQRQAQVQFEAQHYTEEDWDAIRAKIEANA
ncbi:hypothetical protein Tco_0684296 [Tanacetum coccineum]